MPHDEGAMESYDHEESMASTIVHHHMEPSLAGDGAPQKQNLRALWLIQGDQKKATTSPRPVRSRESLSKSLRSHQTIYNAQKQGKVVPKGKNKAL